MRGRDIKRYSYEFPDLHLIATFPSLKIDIELYPAIKQHLMSFSYDRLKQTGEAGARKKTNNKWFETQDAIGYWEDFYRQKIVWKRIGSLLKFSYDDTGAMTLDSTCFATGINIKYLVAVLNSKFGKYLLKNSPQTGTGDLLISVQAIEPLLIPLPNQDVLKEMEMLVDKIYKTLDNTTEIENSINSLLYKQLQFTSKEIDFIEA